MATQYTAGLTTGQVLTAATMNSIGAAWENFTPQLWQGANVNSVIVYAKYARINKVVHVVLQITASAAGTAANAIQVRNLPIAAASSGGIVGSARILDSGTAYYSAVAAGLTTTSINFYTHASLDAFGISPAVTLAVNDNFLLSLTYEAA